MQPSCGGVAHGSRGGARGILSGPPTGPTLAGTPRSVVRPRQPRCCAEESDAGARQRRPNRSAAMSWVPEPAKGS
jgi:hypothetical protein